ncbi:MAG: putative repeat protein (TIGR01451 family)/gliding motility-associated-like protein [Psychromonas sp.]|jgi:uncharacterized repeat protein (TIGR01451 family)/gliding motility-associated-like protein
MKNFNSALIRITTIVVIVLLVSGNVFADGTKQVSPTNSADGAALLVTPELGSGSYFNCPTDQRIRFTVASHDTENLYFGMMPRTYSNNSTSLVTNAYYRIRNQAGTVVSGPTLLASAAAPGFISTYSSAVAGPNIGGANPSGYSPLVFDPTTNGDFFIEIYRSIDNGVSAVLTGSASRITFPFFDFTVAPTAASVQGGRIWCRKWNFVTTDLTNVNFPQLSTSSFTGDFYVNTPDNFKLRVDFAPGFRPLAFELAMNYEGPGTSGDFTEDRKSFSSESGSLTISNAYQVFLTEPDTLVFTNGRAGNPAITKGIYGCPFGYYIPYYTNHAGDVAILLDLNGVPGFQEGTTDVVLEGFGILPGHHVLFWNGNDGLGNQVGANSTAKVKLMLLEGRTNIPIIDAELSINGLSVVATVPNLGNSKLYWDDSNITPFLTCDDEGDANITTGGVVVSESLQGQFGPTHAWNGSNPTTAAPAPANGQGTATTKLCDDYGNLRTINTWFYAVRLDSPVSTLTLPTCDSDNDGVLNIDDIDDDNDGILDLVEHAGLSDPLQDDNFDGTPNYIDPRNPGYADVNFDGVDDRYDFDSDGVMNSFDLDSDNDGVFDIVEAGGVDANNDGRLDNFSDHDFDGYGNKVDSDCNNETNECGGVIGVALPIPNSDGLTTPDYLDLDSDQDGCNDLIEAGFSDHNDDGILGDLPIVVNIFGIVTGTTVTNGYTVSNSNVTTAGAVADVTGQPGDTNAFAGQTGSFKVAASGSGLVYNWQVSMDGGSKFTNVVNGGSSPVYSGANEATLSLSNIPSSANNYKYRARITSRNYACSDVTSDSANLTVFPSANLSVTKTVNNSSPFVGSNVTFIVTVTNGGPSAASAVTVQDKLPSGYAYVSSVPSIGSYNSVSGLWTIGSLGNEASANIAITGTVLAAGTYQNTAASSNPENDPDTINNTATSTPTPVPNADLVITKNVNNGTPNVGDTVDFLLTVSNNGPNTATSVLALDALPTGYTFVSATPSAGTSFSPGKWTINTLTSGANATLTIRASVKASGNYTNTATVSATQTDRNTANNTASVATTPIPVADLTISKTVNNYTPNIGSTVTFTLSVTNVGPSAANNVIVGDTLKSGYTFVNAVPSIGTYSNVTGLWTVGSINSGSGASLTITASVNATGDYSNTAYVEGDEGDPNPPNNASAITLTPVPQSDLTLSKSVNNSTPDVGSNVIFAIAISNNGPSAATGVSVMDTIPAGYTFVSSTATQGSYVLGTNTWTVGGMALNQTVTLYITATVNATGPYLNTASLNAVENDPTLRNNTSSVSITPVAQADIDIIKTVDNATPNVDENVVFQIVVTNTGPSSATNVTATDLLKSGYGFVSVTQTAGSYNSVDGKWYLGTMPINRTDTLWITADVKATGNYANTATVIATEEDPDGPNTSTSTPVPVPQSNLSVVKTVNNPTPYVGTDVTFTITATNVGPSAATNVVVNDSLLSGYSYVSHSPSTGSYVPGTGVWTIGNLANSASAVLTITATVNATGTYVNTAIIGGDEEDPNTTNDTSTVVSVPTPQSDLSVIKSVDNSNPDIGDTVFFTLAVENLGPSDATGVVVDDQLPSGYNYIAGIATNGTYNNVSGVWEINTLANGAKDTLVIEVEVTAITNYTNTATISGDQNDPSNGNNTSISTPNVSNTPPVAVNDSTSTLEDNFVTFNILSNDNDTIDGFLVTDSVDLNLSVAFVQNSYTNAQGTWGVGSFGELTFTPVADYCGNASIVYTVKDDGGASSNIATIKVTVICVNDLPIVDNEYDTTPEETEVSGDLTDIGDSDIEGLLTAVIAPLKDPSNGSIIVKTDGTYAYTPNVDFNGLDTIIVNVCDNGIPSPVLCVADTIFVTVTFVNDPPVTVSDTDTTDEDRSIDITVLANDSDVDGTLEPNTVDLNPAVELVQNTLITSDGTWTVNPAGVVTFTPALNFNGTTFINYKVNDNNGAPSNVASVRVVVLPVNDPPVVDNENLDTPEETRVSGDLTDGGDSDVDGNLVVNTTPTYGPNPMKGSIVISTDGTYTYTPALDFNGKDTIIVEICDDGTPLPKLCTFDTVFVTVRPVNDPPVAVSIGDTTDEDVPVTFNITDNDSDVDGTINRASVDLSIATAGIQDSVTGGTGTWTVDPLGNLTFTPVLNYCGLTSISYTVLDNDNAESNIVTSQVLVNCVNDAPVVSNERVEVAEDGSLTANVLDNDTDVDGDLYAGTTLVYGPNNGTITLASTGAYTYIPNPDFNGLDTVVMSVCDDGFPTPEECVNDTIFVTVTSVNDLPIAVDDIITTLEDVVVTFSITDNDYDTDGTINTSSVDLNPSSPGFQKSMSVAEGAWRIATNGEITFSPAENYCGVVSLNYTVNDNEGATSNIVTITVTVTCVNDAPIVENENPIIAEDGILTANVLDNDTDVDGDLHAETVLVYGPNNGTITLDLTGAYTYTPSPDFNGLDTVVISVCDDGFPTPAECVNDTIFVRVTSVNDAPIVVDDIVETLEDVAVAFSITDNDSDTDGTINTSSVDLNPSSPGFQKSMFVADGTWRIATNGEITFSPAENYCGVVSLNYTVNDNEGATSNIATITVTIHCVNDAPVVSNEWVVVAEDEIVSGDLINGNDSDVDGNMYADTVPDFGPNNGSITIDSTGKYTYTPNPDFNGFDTVVVRVCDDGTPLPAECVNNTIFIRITPINDAPIAVDDINTTLEDAAVTFSITDNDTDADGTVNTSSVDLHAAAGGIQQTRTTTEGIWSVDGNGDLTFTPAPNYCGIATLYYTVEDNNSITSDEATITVTVTCVNDAPIVKNENPIIAEDGSLTANILDNDTDVDGDLYAETALVYGPNNGTITLASTGVYTYTPNPDFNGFDTVVIKVCDDGTPLPAECVNDTIFFTINAVNDAPVVKNDYAEVNEDEVLIATVIDSEDYDVEGNIFVDPSLVKGPSNGEIDISSDGSYTYTPNPNFNGFDTVIVRICDEGIPSPVICVNDTIYITVKAINDAPVIDNEYDTIQNNETASGDLTNIGDSDLDGNLVVNTSPSSGPFHGSVEVNSDGTYIYTPIPDFIGEDLVVVSICDDGTPLPAECVNDTIFILVLSSNTAPIANDDRDTTTEDRPKIVNVTNNDFDAEDNLDRSSVDLDPSTPGIQTTFVTAEGNWIVENFGNVTFIPVIGFIGDASIDYVVSDVQDALSNIATFIVVVLPDNDKDGVSDGVDIDDDNDGIPDTLECGSPLSFCDTDGDEIPDYEDLDSDNDGIPDTYESGRGNLDLNNDGKVDGNIDTDGDGLIDLADGDNGGVDGLIIDFDEDGIPDFQDLDSDNDGITDLVESGGVDSDMNGKIDNFTDANNDGLEDLNANYNPLDSDGDGLTDYSDLDSDNDGVSDVLEAGFVDANGDGIIDGFTDIDNDGLSDPQIGTAPIDFDGDGYPDYLDLDSEQDGIPDVFENGEFDIDLDGRVDDFVDIDGNGWSDNEEGSVIIDTDEDGIPDFHDLDSDQDGIPDVIEGGNADYDHDGKVDSPADNNDNGWSDQTEDTETPDSDGDGIYDYLDKDSDGDGIPDVIEGGFTDIDEDGKVDDFEDIDLNGWDDKVYVNEIPDTDGDGIPDYLDLDSDGDRIIDSEEYKTDCDQDGVDDAYDKDQCRFIVSVPEAISPNGDGFNDKLVITGLEYIPDNTLRIFNRWGDLVYERSDYQNDWEGTSESSMNIGNGELPNGTYYYVLETNSEIYGVIKGFIYTRKN